MKKLLLLTLLSGTLTGCAGDQNWKPIQQVQASNGSTYYWITPLPPSADGSIGPSGRSAGVTTYTGTVNGVGYSASVFK